MVSIKIPRINMKTINLSSNNTFLYLYEVKFKDMKYLDSNPLKGWNKRMKAFGQIWDLEKNNTYIIVSHGNAIKDGIGYILKNLDFKGIENFRWESWCIMTGFKENKLVYEPSIDFWNK